MVGRQLIACAGVSEGLWKTLTKLGIAPGIEQERICSIKVVHDEIMKGLPAGDPHDLWLLLFDNVGFRMQKGYEQYTAMQWVRVSKEILVSWGIYPKDGQSMDDFAFPNHKDEGMQYMSYSDLMKRKEWLEIRDNVDFHDVLGVHETDIDHLATSTFSAIASILEVFEQLPTPDEAINLLATKNKACIESKFHVAEKVREDEVLNEGDDGIVTSKRVHHYLTLNEEEVDDCEEKYASQYERNDAHIDRPAKLDLNSANTCKFLMDYADEHRKQTVNKAAKGRWKNIPKIMEKIPIPLCCDGNPCHQMWNIIKENRSTYDKKVASYAGGFHNNLEGHRKRGDVFGKTHLEDFFWCWRPTEGQLSWVLKPGDPNQISGELPMYVLGLYAAAILGLLTKKEQGIDHEKVDITAKEVVDFMLERAKEWPIVMIILIELRFAELMSMLQECERNGGNVSMFLTATKFFARLYTGSNCTKYVSMLVDFFVEWHCYSEMEKIIFAKGIFLRKTKNGKTIFTVSIIVCHIFT